MILIDSKLSEEAAVVAATAAVLATPLVEVDDSQPIPGNTAMALFDLCTHLT